MIGVSAKMKGHKMIPKKLSRLSNNSLKATKQSLSESAEQLNKIAMDNLQGSLGGSWSKIKWGHSDTTPIGQSKEISPITYQGNILETTLSYSSPHAAVVEFGAVVPHNITENYTPTASPVEKWIHALPGKVFLIGMSQGAGFPRKAFRVQQGYHYLHNAVWSLKFRRGPEGMEGRLYNKLDQVFKRELV